MKEIKPRKKGSFIGTLLRSLIKSIGFEKSASGQEEIVHASVSGGDYHNYRRIETARVEAERKKAQALMEWQKRRFIC
ncbi:MAG: hypothetical protein ACETVQ_00430 [Candidatus Bathyarchaeia archaeon]